MNVREMSLVNSIALDNLTQDNWNVPVRLKSLFAIIYEL